VVSIRYAKLYYGKRRGGVLSTILKETRSWEGNLPDSKAENALEHMHWTN